jgi:hypothetical protein
MIIITKVMQYFKEGGKMENVWLKVHYDKNNCITKEECYGARKE